MQIIIRKKTLKTCGTFLAIAAIFSMGLTMVNWVTPERAAFTGARVPPAAVADQPVENPAASLPETAGSVAGAPEQAAGIPAENAPEQQPDLQTGSLVGRPDAGLEDPRDTREALAGGSDYRVNRLRLQGQHLAALQSRIQDQSLSEEQRIKAKTELLAELKRQELELSCEEGLKIRGYEEPLVSIMEGKAMVLLSEGLAAGDSSQGLAAFVSALAGLGEAQVMVVFPTLGVK